MANICHILNNIWLSLVIHIKDCLARAYKWYGNQGKAASLVFHLVLISAANLWGEMVTMKPCQNLLVLSLFLQTLEQL